MAGFIAAAEAVAAAAAEEEEEEEEEEEVKAQILRNRNEEEKIPNVLDPVIFMCDKPGWIMMFAQNRPDDY